MGKVTLSLDADQEAFVNERIAEGQYDDAGAYFRELVRLDQEHARKLAELRQAIQEGIDSGVSDRTVEQVFEEARQRYRTRHG